MLILGLFSPKIALFWLKGNKTRLKSFLIYFFSMIGFSVLTSIVTPQSYLEEQKKRLAKQDKIEKEKRKKVEEEEKANAVYSIGDANDFKDNTSNYKGLKIQDVFYYDPSNRINLRNVLSITKRYNSKLKYATVEFYYLDKNFNQCNLNLEVPVDIEVPNITTANEKVMINFTCSEGSLYKGNIVSSITRP